MALIYGALGWAVFAGTRETPSPPVASADSEGPGTNRQTYCGGVPAVGLELPLNWPAAVGITEAQKKKMAPINREWHQRAQKLSEKMKAVHTELNRLLAQPLPDTTKVRMQIWRLAALQGELQYAQAEARIKRLRVLTAKQRQVMAELQVGCRSCACSEDTPSAGTKAAVAAKP